jgi:hypothetical protein
MVDTRGLGPRAARCAGSSPVPGTTKKPSNSLVFLIGVSDKYDPTRPPFSRGGENNFYLLAPLYLLRRGAGGEVQNEASINGESTLHNLSPYLLTYIQPFAIIPSRSETSYLDLFLANTYAKHTQSEIKLFHVVPSIIISRRN